MEGPVISYAARDHVTIVNGPPSSTSYDVPVSVIAVALEMREALDNVTAALEACLIHFGVRMSPGDLRTREHHVTVARALLALTKQFPKK